jgi:hypothetical protein
MEGSGRRPLTVDSTGDLMQFLTPLFLLGAALIVVPVILHLVRREKSERVPFASLMFFRRIQVPDLRRRQLKHFLLLLLRCLGVLLLVAAFAQPVIFKSWADRINPTQARSLLVLVDRSFSVSQQPGWQSALQAAESRLQSLQGGDEGMLVQFGESAHVLTEWQQDSAALRQALNRVTPSFEGTSYSEALRVAAEQFREARNDIREILLITDLQRSGMDFSAGWKLPDGISLEVAQVAPVSSNLFIEEVTLQREVFAKTYPHPITVRVGNSPAQAMTGRASLSINGRVLASRDFQVGTGGVGSVVFEEFELPEGIARGEIRVQPLDALPQDNLFHFVVEQQSPRTLLLATDRSRPDSSFYLGAALQAGENQPFVVETTNTLNFARLDPRSTPVVIVNDFPQPDNQAGLEAYLEKGGGVVVILGNGVRSDAYNRAWGGVLPAELVERKFMRAQNKLFTSITDAQWEHPLFAVFAGVHRPSLVGTQFYSYWHLRPKADASVLARFDEGEPALIERRLDRGRLLLFASSLDPVWTDFPLRNSYLPFLHQAVQYASQAQAKPAAFRISQLLPVDQSATAGSWNLLDPSGRRALALGDEIPEYVRLEAPGHYEIRSNRESRWIAANCLPQESNLETVREEEFLAACVPGEWQRTTSQSTSVDSVAIQASWQPVWWLFLILAAIVFGVESLVANRSTTAGQEGR